MRAHAPAPAPPRPAASLALCALSVVLMTYDLFPPEIPRHILP